MIRGNKATVHFQLFRSTYRRLEPNVLQGISDFNVVKLFAKHLFAADGIWGAVVKQRLI